MTVVGLTGSLGTGKSTVAAMFKALGAVVLDADKIAHEALKPQKEPYKRIVKIFGAKVLRKNGAIDRQRLGEQVFRDRRLLKRLSQIIHPYVIRRIKRELKWIKKDYPSAVVILDVPLLIEANLLGMVDKLVVVKTSRAVQVARCLKKTGLAKKEIASRIRLQIPIGRKIRFSDFVINNNGTKNETKREVRKAWERIRL